jgi:DNA-binding winged helix-turn-helix (wHTH) protein
MQVPAIAIARLRVGEFEVDLRCGEVRRNGDKIKLQQRPFQIFAALLQRPGEVVTREEIRQSLWRIDTFVDFEHSINTAVNKLREALGDDAENPRFIETLPRYGYRLMTPVEIVDTNGPCPEVELPPPPPRQASPQPTTSRRLRSVASIIVALLAVTSLALLFSLPIGVIPDPHRATRGYRSPISPTRQHMIAFIRGSDTFVTHGQIYVKMLPDG